MTTPTTAACTPYCDGPCSPECERRCNDVLTLRNNEHMSVTCAKAASHTDAHGDACWGVTWTDGHHA